MAERKPTPRERKTAKRVTNKAKHRGQGDTSRAQGGVRLNAAKQALRDQLIVQRVAEGWTWAAIAAEAGIAPATARSAYKRRVEVAPLQLNTDPVAVVERIFEGYQLSIGGFEAIASAAAGGNNLAVAVGAKKGANDAREKVLALLQATGRLPQEMSSLRHLIDIRAVAVRMLDALEDFERDMVLALGLQEDQDRREAARDAASRVRTTFAELMGLEEPVDASAQEVGELAPPDAGV